LKYNKFYIGVAKADKPLNFVDFSTKENLLRIEPKLQKSEEIEENARVGRIRRFGV
jgi:hypothetical protein